MKQNPEVGANAKVSNGSSGPAKLLFGAAVFHIVVTTSILLVGRQGLLPATFDRNGLAISFAQDVIEYREDVITLAGTLTRDGVHHWFVAPFTPHLKLYSLSFAGFARFTGANILAAEPINLLCYLGILVFVYKIGADLFNRRAALIAACVVALWPSLLLHTTQLLKDPIFIALFLALTWILLRLATRVQTWRSSIVYGLMGTLLTVGLWHIRADLGPVMIASVVLAAATLLWRQLRARIILRPNLAGMTLLALLMMAHLWFIPTFREADSARAREKAREAIANGYSPEKRPFIPRWNLGRRIGILRQGFFSLYPGSSSNIDENVLLQTNFQILRYVPRALAIACFSPFPNKWFETGNVVGAAGRRVSGLETLIMYVLEAFALVGLWQARRAEGVWLLFAVAIAGLLGLGLVVANLGALYRIRYVFMILLIILAAAGICHILDLIVTRQNAKRRAS
jgi:4-amino-4-deoxy-L-arabinose transferase-like glycosyltransferase